jgi:hypothetical protein
MKKNSSIVIKDSLVSTTEKDNEFFVSLTDMARNKNPEEPKDVVKNWMRTRATIEFLGIWERLNNPDFKGVEFDSLMYEAGYEPKERLEKLNLMAISQMRVLISNLSPKILK